MLVSLVLVIILKTDNDALFVSVKEKLAQDPDNEIATTSLRISLLCPVGSVES